MNRSASKRFVHMGLFCLLCVTMSFAATSSPSATDTVSSTATSSTSPSSTTTNSPSASASWAPENIALRVRGSALYISSQDVIGQQIDEYIHIEDYDSALGNDYEAEALLIDGKPNDARLYVSDHRGVTASSGNVEMTSLSSNEVVGTYVGGDGGATDPLRITLSEGNLGSDTLAMLLQSVRVTCVSCAETSFTITVSILAAGDVVLLSQSRSIQVINDALPVISLGVDDVSVHGTSDFLISELGSITDTDGSSFEARNALLRVSVEKEALLSGSDRAYVGNTADITVNSAGDITEVSSGSLLGTVVRGYSGNTLAIRIQKPSAGVTEVQKLLRGLFFHLEAKTYSSVFQINVIVVQRNGLQSHPATLQVRYEACSPGQYLDSGACVACPAGSRCPGGSTAPIACSAGWYALAGSEYCTPCPAGSKCPSQDAVPIACSSGEISELLSTSCESCYGGHSCPSKKASDARPCLPGMYSGTGETVCHACVAGEYCPAGAEAATTCTAPGTYCPPGTEYALACPRGYYCTNTSIQDPVPCSPGTYSTGSATACTACPVGHSCPSTTTSEAVACAAGTYSEGGQTQCTPCPEGVSCASTTSSASVPCVSGTYSIEGASSCTACPAGYACSLTRVLRKCRLGETSAEGDGVCAQCPAGEKCPDPSDPSVNAACAAGHYSAEGEAFCSPCPMGFECTTSAVGSECDCSSSTGCSYSTLGDASCHDCPAGKRCISGGTTPIECAPGEYSALGDKECTTCPANSYCPQGAATPIACSAGDYSVTGSSQCTSCPAGHECESVPGAPVACSRGYYSTSGQNDCSVCDPGYDCREGSTVANPASSPCPENHYCNGTTTEPTACPSGTYTAAVGSDDVSDCLTCPMGHFCPGGAVTSTVPILFAVIEECPSGYYCEAGSGSPTPCPEGSFNPNRAQTASGSCSQCPAGKHCSEGSNADGVPCPQGYFCPAGAVLDSSTKCPPGTFSAAYGLADSTGCRNCTAGHYCPAASPQTYPLPCPEGTYNPYEGFTSSADCRLCEAGFTCPLQGMSCGTCYPCRPGYYCPAGTISPGRSKSGVPLTSTVCPAGYFTNSHHSASHSDCLLCPRGKFCPSGTGGSIEPVDCPSGMYCPGYFPDDHGAVHIDYAEARGVYLLSVPNEYDDVDFRCSDGTYNNLTGIWSQDQCQVCPEGMYCDSAQTFKWPTGACAPGHYCPAGSSREDETACPIGTYNPDPSATDISYCRACPKGAYCPSSGLSAYTNCPAGTYRDAVGGRRLGPADPAEENTEQACVTCPEGSYCPHDGTEEPIPCPTGRYSRANSTSCPLCPAGRYCHETGTTESTMDSQVCPAGLFCTEGFNTFPVSATDSCPVGGYCIAGTTNVTDCPAGTYNPVTGRGSEDDCIPCPAGQFCTEGTSEPDGECAAGYFCPEGSSSATASPCPKRYYREELGAKSQQQCAVCPAGKFCDEATGAPPPCPAGYYCAVGTLEPEPCPRGTYGNTLQLRSLVDCTPCTPGHYCDGLGLTEPRGECDPGYYCAYGAFTSAPTEGSGTGGLCPAGGYCPAGSANFTTCPTGTYNPRVGGKTVEDCIQCPPGYYCLDTQSATPTGPCAAGYYCTGGASQPTQFESSPGHYSEEAAYDEVPCPLGTFNPIFAQSNCTECIEGFFCPEMGLQDYTSNECPAGSYCVSGSIQPTECPVGTYNPNLGAVNASGCLDCPAGKYCDILGLSAPSGNCTEGFLCPAGSVTPTAVDCPLGYYCVEGTILEDGEPCPEGTYAERTRLKNEGECTQCDPGKYCNDTALTEPMGVCSAGYFCPTGTANYYDHPCVPGTYCPEGSFETIPCPAGEYTSSSASTTCNECPPGSFCPSESTAEPVTCPKGYYCPEGSSLATACPVGTVNNLTGMALLSACLPCPAGAQCTAEGLSEPNIVCPAGFYCAGSGSTERCEPGTYCPEGSYSPTDCPSGTYQPLSEASSIDECLRCPGGYACLGTGLSTFSVECAAGYYCSGGASTRSPTDNTTGNICPIGHYCDTGSAIPTVCPAGTYSNAQGLSVCNTCPVGYYCPEGTTSYALNVCPVGYGCPAGTQSPIQHPCPAGYYSNVTGLTDLSLCTACPPGKYCSSPAQTATTGDCSNGYYCTMAASSATPTDGITGDICPSGTYCPSGSSSATTCDGGKFCATSGLSLPTGPCNAGFYCVGGASTSEPTVSSGTGGICPTGRYCEEGTSIPALCPIGTFRGTTGATSESDCHPCTSGSYCSSTGLTAPTGLCTAGFFCEEGSSSPTPAGDECPAGAECPTGSASPVPCSSGTFAAFTGMASCEACPAGYFCLASDGDPVGTVVPEECPEGYYCPEQTGSGTTFACPEGTYSNTTSISAEDDCIPCPPGYYCGSEHLTAPTGRCNAGFICIGAATTASPTDGIEGYECPAAYYCPAGSTSEVPCPSGTYSPSTRATSASACLPCPAGLYCAASGQSAGFDDCDEGHVCLGGSSTSTPSATKEACTSDPTCVGYVCPAGSYCPRGSAFDIPCPAGMFNSISGQSSCVNCTAGQSCPSTGMTAPDTCSAGRYCPVGSNRGESCPRGTYSSTVNMTAVEECTDCPTGYYCPNTGQVTFSAKCASGYFCYQRSSTSAPLEGDGHAQNGPCPQGFYCTTGTTNPSPCPVGTYGNRTALIASYECNPCLAGMACDDVGLAAPNKPCAPGYYCEEGSSTASPSRSTCGLGEYCPEGSASPLPCPEGTYQDEEVQGTCKTCPPGFSCRAGSIVPEACAVNHYCEEGTSPGQEIVCPDGTIGKEIYVMYENVESSPRLDNIYRGLRSSNECSPCPKGFYCTSGNVTGECQGGFFCLEGIGTPTPLGVYNSDGILVGDECPIGTYCLPGSYRPTTCPDGKVNWERRSDSEEKCRDCPPGQECYEGNPIPYPCRQGGYCPGNGVDRQLCPPGTFSAAENATALSTCEKCRPGYYCPDDGATDDTFYPCWEGHYCPEGSNGTAVYEVKTRGRTEIVSVYVKGPLPCPAGRYRSSMFGECSGLSGNCTESCHLCPGGSYCAEGAKEPVHCLGGTYCPDGSGEPQSCPAGSYCEAQSSDPTICPHSNYCPPRSSVPIPCSFGTYCPIGSSEETICPLGTIDRGASVNRSSLEEVCTPCPSGYYGVDPRRETCSLCKAGYVCLEGCSSDKPTDPAVDNGYVCPKGHYCPAGTANPELNALAEEYWFDDVVDAFNASYEYHVRYVVEMNGTVPVLVIRQRPSWSEVYMEGLRLALEANNIFNYELREYATINDIDSAYRNGIYVNPRACPKGYYLGERGASSIDNCVPCPENTYNHLTGMSSCFPCGATSWSNGTLDEVPSLQCTCNGTNRAFQFSDGSCPCIPGYEYFDNDFRSSSADSIVDCQKTVKPTCTSGRLRDFRGDCVAWDDPEYCYKEEMCGPDGGTYLPQQGVCQCNNTITHVNAVCDSNCRNNEIKVEIKDGQLQICSSLPCSDLSRMGEIDLLDSIGFGLGSSACDSEDGCEMRILRASLAATTGVYNSSSAYLASLFNMNSISANSTSRRLAGVRVLGGKQDILPFRTSSHHRSLFASDSDVGSTLENPVVCLSRNSILAWDILDDGSYPVYQKDSILNSNPSFDYGLFAELARMIESGANPGVFAFQFTEDGTYVFSSKSSQKLTIIKVQSACEEGISFLPSTESTFSRLGVTHQIDPQELPNWVRLGVVVIGLVLFLLGIVGGLHQFRKESWGQSEISKYKQLGKTKSTDDGAKAMAATRRGSLPFASMGEVGNGENGAISDFNARTFYDKLEDQTIHVMSKMTSDSEEITRLYEKIFAETEVIRQMLQTQMSHTRKAFTRASDGTALTLPDLREAAKAMDADTTERDMYLKRAAKTCSEFESAIRAVQNQRDLITSNFPAFDLSKMKELSQRVQSELKMLNRLSASEQVRRTAFEGNLVELVPEDTYKLYSDEDRRHHQLVVRVADAVGIFQSALAKMYRSLKGMEKAHQKKLHAFDKNLQHPQVQHSMEVYYSHAREADFAFKKATSSLVRKLANTIVETSKSGQQGQHSRKDARVRLQQLIVQMQRTGTLVPTDSAENGPTDIASLIKGVMAKYVPANQETGEEDGEASAAAKETAVAKRRFARSVHKVAKEIKSKWQEKRKTLVKKIEEGTGEMDARHAAERTSMNERHVQLLEQEAEIISVDNRKELRAYEEKLIQDEVDGGASVESAKEMVRGKVQQKRQDLKQKLDQAIRDLERKQEMEAEGLKSSQAAEKLRFMKDAEASVNTLQEGVQNEALAVKSEVKLRTESVAAKNDPNSKANDRAVHFSAKRHQVEKSHTEASELLAAVSKEMITLLERANSMTVEALRTMFKQSTDDASKIMHALLTKTRSRLEVMSSQHTYAPNVDSTIRWYASKAEEELKHFILHYETILEDLMKAQIVDSQTIINDEITLWGTEQSERNSEELALVKVGKMSKEEFAESVKLLALKNADTQSLVHLRTLIQMYNSELTKRMSVISSIAGECSERNDGVLMWFEANGGTLSSSRISEHHRAILELDIWGQSFSRFLAVSREQIHKMSEQLADMEDNHNLGVIAHRQHSVSQIMSEVMKPVASLNGRLTEKELLASFKPRDLLSASIKKMDTRLQLVSGLMKRYAIHGPTLAAAMLNTGSQLIKRIFESVGTLEEVWKTALSDTQESANNASSAQARMRKCLTKVLSDSTESAQAEIPMIIDLLQKSRITLAQQWTNGIAVDKRYTEDDSVLLLGCLYGKDEDILEDAVKGFTIVHEKNLDRHVEKATEYSSEYTASTAGAVRSTHPLTTEIIKKRCASLTVYLKEVLSSSSVTQNEYIQAFLAEAHKIECSVDDRWSDTFNVLKENLVEYQQKRSAMATERAKVVRELLQKLPERVNVLLGDVAKILDLNSNGKRMVLLALLSTLFKEETKRQYVSGGNSHSLETTEDGETVKKYASKFDEKECEDVSQLATSLQEKMLGVSDEHKRQQLIREHMNNIQNIAKRTEADRARQIALLQKKKAIMKRRVSMKRVQILVAQDEGDPDGVLNEALADLGTAAEAVAKAFETDVLVEGEAVPDTVPDVDDGESLEATANEQKEDMDQLKEKHEQIIEQLKEQHEEERQALEVRQDEKIQLELAQVDRDMDDEKEKVLKEKTDDLKRKIEEAKDNKDEVQRLMEEHQSSIHESMKTIEYQRETQKRMLESKIAQRRARKATMLQRMHDEQVQRELLVQQQEEAEAAKIQRRKEQERALSSILSKQGISVDSAEMAVAKLLEQQQRREMEEMQRVHDLQKSTRLLQKENVVKNKFDRLMRNLEKSSTEAMLANPSDHKTLKESFEQERDRLQEALTNEVQSVRRKEENVLRCEQSLERLKLQQEHVKEMEAALAKLNPDVAVVSASNESVSEISKELAELQARLRRDQVEQEKELKSFEDEEAASRPGEANKLLEGVELQRQGSSVAKAIASARENFEDLEGKQQVMNEEREKNRQIVEKLKEELEEAEKRGTEAVEELKNKLLNEHQGEMSEFNTQLQQQSSLISDLQKEIKERTEEIQRTAAMQVYAFRSEQEWFDVLMRSPIYKKLRTIETLITSVEESDEDARIFRAAYEPYMDSQDLQWTDGTNLQPVPDDDLSLLELVNVRATLGIMEHLTTTMKMKAFKILACGELPPTKYEKNAFARSYFFEPGSQTLFVRRERLAEIGSAVIVCTHAAAHIHCGQMNDDTDHTFQGLWYKCLRILCAEAAVSRSFTTDKLSTFASAMESSESTSASQLEAIRTLIQRSSHVVDVETLQKKLILLGGKI